MSPEELARLTDEQLSEELLDGGARDLPVEEVLRRLTELRKGDAAQGGAVREAVRRFLRAISPYSGWWHGDDEVATSRIVLEETIDRDAPEPLIVDQNEHKRRVGRSEWMLGALKEREYVVAYLRTLTLWDTIARGEHARPTAQRAPEPDTAPVPPGLTLGNALTAGDALSTDALAHLRRTVKFLRNGNVGGVKLDGSLSHTLHAQADGIMRAIERFEPAILRLRVERQAARDVATRATRALAEHQREHIARERRERSPNPSRTVAREQMSTRELRDRVGTAALALLAEHGDATAIVISVRRPST